MSSQQTKSYTRTPESTAWMKEPWTCPKCGRVKPKGGWATHFNFCGRPYEPVFWSKVLKIEDGCWLWQGAKKHDGYGLLNRLGKMKLAHRYSWELANGPIPEGKYALHHCDNPACVNPEHMYLGSKKDNARDKILRGRDTTRGEGNIHSRLTEAQVREIIPLKGVISGCKLAKKYNVNPGSIHAIWRGKAWKHIPR